MLAGCYRPQAENDPVAALQQAMDLLQGAQPLQKKLDEALRKGRVQEVPGQSPIDAAVGAGVLSAEEAQSLHQAETARRVVIDVDDFAKEELKLGRGKVR
ncbi:hypothetical protein D9M70_630740 [compost metagenome]